MEYLLSFLPAAMPMIKKIANSAVDNFMSGSTQKFFNQIGLGGPQKLEEMMEHEIDGKPEKDFQQTKQIARKAYDKMQRSMLTDLNPERVMTPTNKNRSEMYNESPLRRRVKAGSQTGRKESIMSNIGP